MYEQLININKRPFPFSIYTADTLWTDPHISQQMLKTHLDQNTDLASRRLSFIEASVSWLQRRFNIGPGTRLADFGCGPGLYTTRLAQLGATVTGVDFSANSLAYAKETAVAQNLPIHYIHTNYLEFQSDQRFDLITLIYCDFCALSPAQRQTLLGIFREHLADGGAIVLDVHSLVEYDKFEEGVSYGRNQSGNFWTDEDYFSFTNQFKYEAERVTLDKYSIFTPTRSFAVYNWLQHFDQASLTAEFIASGLTITDWYANVAGEPFEPQSPTIAVVAQPT
ncbi:MAG: class I SAM-dependent methyltransferase [Ardenticatenaceae bacterium]|nr:class I SAM-dependent methyltransferase [Anaerolineales bacterium]MCB8941940.1 class I SAM-dependent methyltransferase [Ardenticatenaceae bacterium]MCB8973053.1 class I SAM-dependent methyltransferase [Ardenticatenaceae bacterium]